MFLYVFSSLEVKAFRTLNSMQLDENLIHLDGNGIKILFNHGIRRFMARQSTRESKLVPKTFTVLFSPEMSFPGKSEGPLAANLFANALL